MVPRATAGEVEARLLAWAEGQVHDGPQKRRHEKGSGLGLGYTNR